ncbi:uncharacterized protein LOC143917686 [Arctopsyche grandis]|uniref:uncharacterized protein LOC143917686 n=1 Tax=Arctopsyche grandis TaxID=121162 RepID=UPI00406DA3AD
MTTRGESPPLPQREINKTIEFDRKRSKEAGRTGHSASRPDVVYVPGMPHFLWVYLTGPNHEGGKGPSSVSGVVARHGIGSGCGSFGQLVPVHVNTNMEETRNLWPKLEQQFRSIVDVARCRACFNLYRRPQKSLCGHIACAICWRRHDWRCGICDFECRGNLYPDEQSKRLTTAITNMAKSISKVMGVDVLTNEETEDSSNEEEVEDSRDELEDENSPNEEEEENSSNKVEFGNTPNEEVEDSSNAIEFGNSPNKINDSLSNLTNVNKEKSVESDAGKCGCKTNDSNVSRKSCTDKDISNEHKIEKENSWGQVRKVKKMLKKVGKKTTKKLNVSVEVNTKSSGSPNIDLNDSSDSHRVIENVNTPPISNLNYTTKSDDLQIVATTDSLADVICISEEPLVEEKVCEKTENIPPPASNSLPDVIFVSRDELSLEEKRDKCKGVPVTTSESLSDVIFVSKDTLALEEVRTKSRNTPFVRFVYFGALAKKHNVVENLCQKKKRVPFFYSAPCSTRSSCTKPEQDECVKSNKRPRKADKSPDDSFDVQVNNLAKRNKLEPIIHVNNDMVIHFESQSQAETQLSSNKESVGDKNECVSNGIIKKFNTVQDSTPIPMSEADEKFLALKKDVKFYMGDDLNSTKSSVFKDKIHSEDLIPSVEIFTPKDTEKPNDELLQQFDRIQSNTQLTPSLAKNLSEELEKIPNSQISNVSVVEDTPQKNNSLKIGKKSILKNSKKSTPRRLRNTSQCEDLEKIAPNKSISDSDMDLTSVCNLAVNNLNKNTNSISVDTLINNNMDTPSNISSFFKDITYQSTPLQPRAKRTLSYDKAEAYSKIVEQTETSIDAEQCVTVVANSSHSTHSKTLRENDFMQQAFDKSCEDGRQGPIVRNSKRLISNKSKSSKSVAPKLNHDSGIRKKMLGNVIRTKSSPISTANVNKSSDRIQAKNICIACSCLPLEQKNSIMNLATSMGWNFTETFSKDMTHLIVKVDQDNISSRSVKYMQAVASGCWIVSFKWAEQCINTKSHAEESEFEVLDSSGKRGPFASRTSKVKVFHNMTFYLLPPITIVPIEQAAEIIQLAGGSVVNSLTEVAIKDPKKISIVITDEANSQESRFLDLCVLHKVFPINIAWMLECIGRGDCVTLDNYILVNRSLYPVIDWPEKLLVEYEDSDSDSDSE